MGFVAQSSPFSYVMVDNLLRGNAKILWALEDDFDESTPYTFQVQWARAGNNTWTTVTTVVDTYYATDTSQRETSALLEGYYRIRFTTGDSTVYLSKPAMLPAQWTTRDLRFAEEIKRREAITYRQDYGGFQLWLFLRKNYGTKCSSCVDPVSGEVEASRCSSCYGTGFEGGYHVPYLTTGKVLTPDRQAIKQTELGTGFSKQKVIRFCPFPLVAEDDFVVLAGSDQRLRVGQAATVAEVKGIPIIQHLLCSLAPVSDAIYDVRMPTATGATGGSPTGSDSDWD